MTSISNLLIHDDVPNTSPIVSYLPSPSYSHCSLPPIHGDDPPRKLRYHDSLLSPPPTHFYSTPEYQTLASPPLEPIKRKRGRPPSFSDPQDDQITFLTPTVCNIPMSKDQIERELKAKHTPLDQINDSMTAFTASNMDTVLYMPRKKRGRKPKTFIHGNSCFIWKDLTSTRSSK